jgi:lipoprotein-anchoring transpeptidase ErfK/SrfK
MLKKLIASAVVLVCFGGMATANPFAEKVCTTYTMPNGWECVRVPAGTSWNRFVPDEEYRSMIKRYNRQNTILHAGQFLVIPPNTGWNNLAPFDQTGHSDRVDVIVFDPQRLAWAHYLNGRLITWGPAVGGKDWCPDKNNRRGGPCRTDVGTFHFTEAADATRRSNAYPINCGQPGGRPCAAMPYFTRFTSDGQGIHKRSMRGANASHGCIGVFAEDAQYINGHVRARVGKQDHGYFTEREKAASSERVLFRVLPYSSSVPNS